MLCAVSCCCSRSVSAAQAVKVQPTPAPTQGRHGQQQFWTVCTLYCHSCAMLVCGLVMLRPMPTQWRCLTASERQECLTSLCGCCYCCYRLLLLLLLLLLLQRCWRGRQSRVNTSKQLTGSWTWRDCPTSREEGCQCWLARCMCAWHPCSTLFDCTNGPHKAGAQKLAIILCGTICQLLTVPT